MRMLCNRASALIFTVTPASPPEHTYPAAPYDALVATRPSRPGGPKWHDRHLKPLPATVQGVIAALITTLRLKAASAPPAQGPAASLSHAGCPTRAKATAISR